MRSDFYILEKKYREMKVSYDGVINANIKLQDERDLARADVKIIQKRLSNAIDYIKTSKEFSKEELLDILENG